MCYTDIAVWVSVLAANYGERSGVYHAPPPGVKGYLRGVTYGCRHPDVTVGNSRVDVGDGCGNMGTSSAIERVWHIWHGSMANGLCIVGNATRRDTTGGGVHSYPRLQRHA